MFLNVSKLIKSYEIRWIPKQHLKLKSKLVIKSYVSLLFNANFKKKVLNAFAKNKCLSYLQDCLHVI